MIDLRMSLEPIKTIVFPTGGLKTTDEIILPWDLPERPHIINQQNFPVTPGEPLRQKTANLYACCGWTFEEIETFFKYHPELNRPTRGDGIYLAQFLMEQEGESRKHVPKEYIICPHEEAFLDEEEEDEQKKLKYLLFHREAFFRELKLSPCGKVSFFSSFFAIV
jgi:hypothetical protein